MKFFLYKIEIFFIYAKFYPIFILFMLTSKEQSKYRAVCKKDSDCENPGTATYTWNGIPTGRCINSTFTKDVKVCEVAKTLLNKFNCFLDFEKLKFFKVKAWCPTEHDSERLDKCF